MSGLELGLIDFSRLLVLTRGAKRFLSAVLAYHHTSTQLSTPAQLFTLLSCNNSCNLDVDIQAFLFAQVDEPIPYFPGWADGEKFALSAQRGKAPGWTSSLKERLQP